MLKNYTVIVKNVKKEKYKTLLKYLNDEKHKNHTKKETEIFELSDREKFEEMTAERLAKNEENYYNPEKGYRGGRKLKVVHKSFTFNLPKDYKKIATVEKCRELDEKLKKKITQAFGRFGVDLSSEELYSVLHYQDNPHIHLVLPYLDKNGNTIRQIKPKGFTTTLKILFSETVDEVLGTDIKKYEAVNSPARGTSRELEEALSWYQTLIRMDGREENKYYKNQIKRIERMLKKEDAPTADDLEAIAENMEAVEEMREEQEKKTPAKPFFKKFKM